MISFFVTEEVHIAAAANEILVTTEQGFGVWQTSGNTSQSHSLSQLRVDRPIGLTDSNTQTHMQSMRGTCIIVTSHLN